MYLELITNKAPIKIPVYEDDTAEGLAEDFCHKNKLNRQIEQQLVEIFRKRIDDITKNDDSIRLKSEILRQDISEPIAEAEINDEITPKGAKKIVI